MATEVVPPFNTRIDEVVEQALDYNRKALEVSKKIARASVDSYEANVGSVLDLQQKLSDGATADAVLGVVPAQVESTRSLAKAQTDAVRKLLN